MEEVIKPVIDADEQTAAVNETEEKIKRLERAAAEAKAAADRLETLQLNAALGGRSTGGQIPAKPISVDDLSPQEYLEKWRKGEIKGKLPGT